MRKGNVFTGVCMSTGGRCTPPRQTPPWPDTPSRQTTPLPRWPLQWTVRILLECILVEFGFLSNFLNGLIMICMNVQLRVFPLQKMLKTCMTPLIIASRKGDHKIVKQLLKAGARPDARGPDGKTALVVALSKDSRSAWRCSSKREPM